jgi:hypothetical protein
LISLLINEQWESPAGALKEWWSRKSESGVPIEDQTMIETPEQLYQAIEQMGRMQRILESYRNEILTRNPRNFAMLAEGPLEQIRQLQAQIDEYVRHLEETPA